MASPQQQQMEQNAVSSFRAFMGGFSSVSRNMQAIAGEIAKMSEENIGCGTKAAERLRDAHSLQEVTGIQSDLLKECYTTTTDHYRKITEIAMSAPQELAHSAGEIASTLAQAAQGKAERTSETVRQTAGQAAGAAEKASETAQTAFRQGCG